MSALPQYGRHLHPQETMRAVVIDRYGGPEMLHAATVPRPVPTRGQVLVRTRFIGVNPKDVVVRKGKFQVATGKKFPLIVGHDIAGEVVEAGLGADLAEGDLVYGMINDLAGRGICGVRRRRLPAARKSAVVGRARRSGRGAARFANGTTRPSRRSWREARPTRLDQRRLGRRWGLRRTDRQDPGR